MTIPAANIQLNAQGQLQHFLSIEGLNRALIIQILDDAQRIVAAEEKQHPPLCDKTITNLFFEPSTRTRTTFELAAKRLGANVMNININTSATVKGESLLDTLRNLEAMHSDMFIVRHEASGAAHFIAQHVQPEVAVINGGDGSHAHPTQALLDMLTIRQHKPNFAALKVAIVGDILHSRVARSQIYALNILGVSQVHLVAPKTLLPRHINQLGVKIFHDIHHGLTDVDVIIMLRLQRERMQNALLPSTEEYFSQYGLTARTLAIAKPDALVMHPGPINRGVEIASSVADGPQSVILEQVTNGIALRMAIMTQILSPKINTAGTTP